MDPGSHDLFSQLAVLASVLVTFVLAFFVVRTARRRRRAEIERVGEPPPLPREALKAALPAPEAAAPPKPSEPEPPPANEPRPEAASPEKSAEAPSPTGRVLPFPSPSPTAVPQEKPRAEPEPAPAPSKRRDGALVAGLAKTRGGFITRLGQIFVGKKELDPALVDEIEKVLLTADIGVRTSAKLLDEIRQSLSKKELANPDAVWTFLRRRTAEILTIEAPPLDFNRSKPFVLLVIGVNGTGKTTTIGKLAAHVKAGGHSVLLAAGDTFRAAAAEQLEVWGSRAGAPVVRGKEGADPSSVLFDGVKRAKTEGIKVVIADTAGRLHTKTELMEELQKVRRVIGKAAEGAPHETWLVLDATSGQNAIAQAQIFTQAMQVTGIVLTKLDGTAKGGVILGIADQLRIPVRFIGVGERVEDLRVFDAEEFVDALFEGAGDGANSEFPNVAS